MIAVLYLITPLIKVFTDNATKKQLEAFMVLSFIFVNVMPMVLCIPFINEIGFKEIYDDMATYQENKANNTAEALEKLGRKTPEIDELKNKEEVLKQRL